MDGNLSPAARRHALAGAAALLAGTSVFIDGLVSGRGLAADLTIDLPLGLALALAAGIASLAGQRLSRTRAAATESARCTGALADAAWAVSHTDHAHAVLDRLSAKAREILGVEKAAVFLRDRSDPRTSIVVAGSGVPQELIGHRFGIDEGMAGQVFMTGMPVVVTNYQQFRHGVDHTAASDMRAGGAVPIRWGEEVRGALTVGSTRPDRVIGGVELETLERLAEVGGMALEQAEMRDRLELALESGVEALAAALDRRDAYTAKHSHECVKLALEVGDRLGLDEAELRELALAARLHDVGKIGVPDSILNKPGELDHEEWEIMKQHPVWGAELLERIDGMEPVAVIVRAAHERWDGEGYPDGLRGNQIPLGSRIVSACDAYSAMISDRPYRVGLRPWMAVSRLRDSAGSQFDPDVVETLVGVLREAQVSATRLSPVA